MQAEIVLGEITPSAADFADLADARGEDGYAGADGGAIAFCADELEEHTVVRGAIGVEEHGGRLADVEQDNVDISGVEDVAKSGATTRL